jgi:hypothetical protein
MSFVTAAPAKPAAYAMDGWARVGDSSCSENKLQSVSTRD